MKKKSSLVLLVVFTISTQQLEGSQGQYLNSEPQQTVNQRAAMFNSSHEHKPQQEVTIDLQATKIRAQRKQIVEMHLEKESKETEASLYKNAAMFLGGYAIISNLYFAYHTMYKSEE